MEYDRWQVRYHGTTTRLNFPFGMAPVHLVLPEPGVVRSAMAREDREARERLLAEATDEACMQELCRQRPEVVEVEQMMFVDAAGVVMVISSDDEVKGDEDDGAQGGEYEDIDVDERRSVCPDDEDEDIGSDPNRGTPYVMRKDWLDLTFDQK
ncbi:Bifunctional dihydroflavonol 4-reductase/flavanone 4-reductase [Hordeum vulgare]|nr:Bifunctional dihydroflavonol 4-reductase/flavanone 4-reductase [Hordeum vulgare]